MVKSRNIYLCLFYVHKPTEPIELVSQPAKQPAKSATESVSVCVSLLCRLHCIILLLKQRMYINGCNVIGDGLEVLNILWWCLVCPNPFDVLTQRPVRNAALISILESMQSMWQPWLREGTTRCYDYAAEWLFELIIARADVEACHYNCHSSQQQHDWGEEESHSIRLHSLCFRWVLKQWASARPGSNHTHWNASPTVSPPFRALYLCELKYNNVII